MRVTDLLGREVLDADGMSLGPVRDIRMRWDEQAVPPPGVSSRFDIAGLVVGDGRFAGAAHAWGFAEGRADGPALLRVLFSQAVQAARFVPVAYVSSWGPDRIQLCCREAQLKSLAEELAE